MSSSDKTHALYLFSAHSCANGHKKYDMLEKGDLIKIKRKYCWHWAVYYGRGTVIHVIVEHKEEGICKAVIDFQSLDEVLDGDTFKKGNKKDSKWTPFLPAEIIKRAQSNIGEFTYNIITDNCEHFARWCRYGVDYCNQAKIIKAWLPDKYFQILLKRLYDDLTGEERILIKEAIKKLENLQCIAAFSCSQGVRNAPVESLAKGPTNGTSPDFGSAIELSAFPPAVIGASERFMERQRTPLC